MFMIAMTCGYNKLQLLVISCRYYLIVTVKRILTDTDTQTLNYNQLNPVIAFDHLGNKLNAQLLTGNLQRTDHCLVDTG